MARQAVEAFRRQTYENKWLLIWDTGELNQDLRLWRRRNISEHFPNYDDGKIVKPWSVGELRNAGTPSFRIMRPKPDIICHWDDDDLSHPNRIAEQVALLQSSGADAVGYRQMLFWREPVKTARVYRAGIAAATSSGEAWVYTGAICGTSLMYWRKTWEAHQFPAVSDGEDTQFITALAKVKGVSSLPPESRGYYWDVTRG